MSNRYIDAFRAAQQWTNRHVEPEISSSLAIQPSKHVDMHSVIRALAMDFEESIENSALLPGHCFQVVREASYVLMDIGIRHEVTIGDVILPDRRYIGMSKQRLKKELRAGYRIAYDETGIPIGVPADAHAWITFESGQFLDATILSSMSKSAGGDPLAFVDCFFHSEMTNPIEHVPFMAGFGYHWKVLTDPRDRFFHVFSQWYIDHFRFMQQGAS